MSQMYRPLLRSLFSSLILSSACASVPSTVSGSLKVGSKVPMWRAATLNPQECGMTEVELTHHVGPKRIASDQTRGVVLSFGASHCLPCLLELPLLQNVEAHYRERGLLMVLVVTDEDDEGLERMREFALDRLGIRFPVVVDPVGELASLYGVTELPFMVMIDPEGKVVWQEVGFKATTMEALEYALQVLLSPDGG